MSVVFTESLQLLKMRVGRGSGCPAKISPGTCCIDFQNNLPALLLSLSIPSSCVSPERPAKQGCSSGRRPRPDSPSRWSSTSAHAHLDTGHACAVLQSRSSLSTDRQSGAPQSCLCALPVPFWVERDTVSGGCRHWSSRQQR